jgi:hypothetical protein
MLEVIVQYTDTNGMFHILSLIPQRFNFLSSQEPEFDAATAEAGALKKLARKLPRS